MKNRKWRRTTMNIAQWKAIAAAHRALSAM
jgi:hypothetical protein